MNNLPTHLHSHLPRQVYLTEVGPRDGLQNEAQRVDVATKVELCKRLLAAGITSLEIGAFVSPKWVPQMADTAEVFKELQPHLITKNLRYSALTPNLQGFEAALSAGANEVVIFGAASETFTQKNIHCTIHESLQRFAPVAAAAHRHGLRLRAALSCALGCPYEGRIPTQKVIEVLKQLRDLGCHEIGIADTIGVGTPNQTSEVFNAALRELPTDHLSGHFHDTYGQALANIYACLQLGIYRFDTSVAGLGGCPYAKGASGNVATEDVLYMLHGMGIITQIDLPSMVQIGQWISKTLGKPAATKAGNALDNLQQTITP